jgi:predicted aconitase with swiveling domain
MEFTLIGSPVFPGEVFGELLASNEPLSFWGGFDYRTGMIIDKRHPLGGRMAANKILAVPFNRGSSTTTAILLEAVKAKTAPAAILSLNMDSFFALASIVADEMYQAPIPLITVKEHDFALLQTGDSAQISLDGTIFIRPGRSSRKRATPS